MYEFNLVLLLLQQMCVFLVIAWLMSKTRLFIPLMQVTVPARGFLVLGPGAAPPGGYTNYKRVQ